MRTNASAIAGASLERDCFGWSWRAWRHPWRAWLRDAQPQGLATGLELGAGVMSSLAPLMLEFTQQVECSCFDQTFIERVKALHLRVVAPSALHKIAYSQQDVLALTGRWDVIVMKSVLGGVFRTNSSQLTDVQALLASLVRDHLNPGGWLITLDNGRTAIEPLLKRFGARRNHWRFFRHEDFPAADAFHSFGCLGTFSAASRLCWIGRCVDDVIYGLDWLLTPWIRRRAVLLHAYRKP